ncbi:MAG: 4Fe-4S cluster-binding domain-containing protein [Patescibacteria group bacterium]|nr:4Fe-4S cluster-binding domain-containing protein [Patescibacteria group bacterium]
MSNSVKIAWYGKHFGEEPPLVGDQGAGTIFFTGCNLRCVYCQNYQISQQGLGKKFSIKELADIMLTLAREGAVNIDLVSPTIWAKEIKQAIVMAQEQGLKLPIIWNSNAYESLDVIESMKGLVDIYLPDFKYGSDSLAFKYSGVKDYLVKAKAAVGAMLLQVGHLQLDKNKIAIKGLMVRHLVLPNNAENSFMALNCLKEINQDIRVNLMSQYAPVFKAKNFPELRRNVAPEEYEKVFHYMLKLGLDQGWAQAPGSHSVFLPDFTKENPFG